MATNFVQAEHKSRLSFNWREWALLTLLGTLAALTVLPAVWTQYQQIAQARGVTVPALVLNQVLQTVIFVGLAVAIGLFFAHRIGLGAPIVEGWLVGEKVGTQVRSILSRFRRRSFARDRAHRSHHAVDHRARDRPEWYVRITVRLSLLAAGP